MSYALNHDISFCVVDDSILILDLAHDRYLCLEPRAGSAVRRLLDGGNPTVAEQRQLDRIVDKGILVHCEGQHAIRPCPALPAPVSNLSANQQSASVSDLLPAYGKTLVARLALKTFGLRRAVAHLVRIKHKRRDLLDANPPAVRIAVAFREMRLWLSPLDQCVPRSLAIMHFCLARQVDAKLIIGVRLKPFGAHCWVQRGTKLVDEDVDIVRLFTPILVI